MFSGDESLGYNLVFIDIIQVIWSGEVFVKVK